MSDRFYAETLDLSRVGPRTLVDPAFDPILRDGLASLKAIWLELRAIDPGLPDLDGVDLTSDPGHALMREFGLRESGLRQAINDHGDALTLAFASGADLDHLANTYANTPRLVLDPGDPTTNPPRPPVYELDEEYRRRAQLAPEAFPMFGLTPGGYIWRVRRSFGDRVKGVRALKRPGGHIALVILARAGDGTPAPELIGDIQAAFEGEAASQSTDIVTVQPARIVPTAITVEIVLPPGPAPGPVVTAARLALEQLAAERHAIGETLHAQAVGAVAKVAPVRYARVIEPAIDVVGDDDGAPFVTAITVTPRVER